MLKKWYQQDGAHAGIVISTRIRLARNLAGIPFPGNMTGEQEKEVIEKCLAALRADESALPEKLKFIDFKGLSPVQIRSLTERHLISPDFEKPGGEKALLLSDDESVSIMINEEDHLRIQCIAAGMELKETLRRANQVDDLADAGLDLAFDEHLGYLTHCPTNLGTGLRASVMLHLPILTGNGQIGQVVEAVSKMGLTVRGMYGEGTKAQGCIYQVSNQLTLGQTEEEIIGRLGSVVEQVIEQELAMEKAVYKNSPWQLEDRVWRAYGALKNARLLSAEETMRQLSDIRLGKTLGILKDIDDKALNYLTIMTGPANIALLPGTDNDPASRDHVRAGIVREAL